MTLREKITKAKKSKKRRTSIEWCDYFEINSKDILDPDGWNRTNFHYDFFQKEITYSQFDDKVGSSTCQRTAWEYCRETIEIARNQNGDNGQTNADGNDIASTESEVNIETEEESKPTNGGTSSEENR